MQLWFNEQKKKKKSHVYSRLCWVDGNNSLKSMINEREQVHDGAVKFDMINWWTLNIIRLFFLGFFFAIEVASLQTVPKQTCCS